MVAGTTIHAIRGLKREAQYNQLQHVVSGRAAGSVRSGTRRWFARWN